MKITYDPKAEAIYIYVTEGKRQPKVEELDDRVWVDRGEKDEVLGIEILYVENLEVKVNDLP
jgi:uncharacterized protein YuzE